MKKQLLFTFLLCSFTFFGQINYSQLGHQLENVSGIQHIDGAKINPDDRFVTIKINKMDFSNRSALLLSNCLILVDGTVDADVNCQIRLVNSYIICKNYNGNPSPRIKKTKQLQNCKVSEIPFLKNVGGHEKIQIIDKSGKIVLSGNKESIKNQEIQTGVYDVRAVGKFYESNILVASY